MLSMTKHRAAWLSVASNSLLTAGKLTAGLMSGSVSVLSEAAHSANDLLASGIATFSVHMADRPPDQDHPYGHEKIENISGVIEGLLIFGAAGWIIFEAVGRLRHGGSLHYLGPGAAVMAVSALVNLGVATVLQRTALATRSVALEADAAHLFTDVYTSAGVFLGLVFIQAGKIFFNRDLAWLDPVIAIAVALLILRTSYQITRKSFQPLLDAAASPNEETKIRSLLAEYQDRGADFHQLRSRRAGGSLHVDLHMGFRPGMTLENGHQLSHELKARIEKELPGAKVLIHLEPSAQIRQLPGTDFQVRCIRDELARELRVCEVRKLEVFEYRGEIRVDAELCLDPAVTMAESHALTHDLRRRLQSCFPAVNEVVLSLRPGQGWQEAIHEDDKKRIRELVGEREGRLAMVHELEVASSGSQHRVLLRLGVPPSLPVAEAHRIGTHLEDVIRTLFPQGAEIVLHLEPCHERCESCSAACTSRIGVSKS